jgi:hypothetical protein
MPYLDLGGERSYYAVHHNQVAGAPVVLIHGAGENHLVWPIGLRRLPGTIVAIDLGSRQIDGSGCSTIADCRMVEVILGAAHALSCRSVAGGRLPNSWRSPS